MSRSQDAVGRDLQRVENFVAETRDLADALAEFAGNERRNGLFEAGTADLPRLKNAAAGASRCLHELADLAGDEAPEAAAAERRGSLIDEAALHLGELRAAWAADAKKAEAASYRLARTRAR